MVYKGLLMGWLKIFFVFMGKYIIFYFLVDFMKIYFGVEFELDVINRSEVIESFGKNDIDFGLVFILFEYLEVSNIELM